MSFIVPMYKKMPQSSFLVATLYRDDRYGLVINYNGKSRVVVHDDGSACARDLGWSVMRDEKKIIFTPHGPVTPESTSNLVNLVRVLCRSSARGLQKRRDLRLVIRTNHANVFSSLARMCQRDAPRYTVYFFDADGPGGLGARVHIGVKKLSFV